MSLTSSRDVGADNIKLYSILFGPGDEFNWFFVRAFYFHLDGIKIRNPSMMFIVYTGFFDSSLTFIYLTLLAIEFMLVALTQFS